MSGLGCPCDIQQNAKFIILAQRYALHLQTCQLICHLPKAYSLSSFEKFTLPLPHWVSPARSFRASRPHIATLTKRIGSVISSVRPNRPEVMPLLNIQGWRPLLPGTKKAMTGEGKRLMLSISTSGDKDLKSKSCTVHLCHEASIPPYPLPLGNRNEAFFSENRSALLWLV